MIERILENDKFVKFNQWGGLLLSFSFVLIIHTILVEQSVFTLIFNIFLISVNTGFGLYLFQAQFFKEDKILGKNIIVRREYREDVE